MQPAGGEPHLQNQPTSAEQQTQAGDQDVGTTMDDLQVDDLGRPITHEGVDMPEDQAPAASNPTSPAKKKFASPATAKTNGTASNPIVKKVLNAGTFGSSSVKPAGHKVTAGGAVRPSAPVLKKSTTSPPAVASKTGLASSTSSKPTSAAPPTRRMSVVPAKANAPGLAKQSLSASASTKPPEDPALRASPTGSVGSSRGPIVTPAPARPRASVSEAVRKPPTASRPSIASSARPSAPSKAPTLARSSAAPTVKASRGAGSISSIKEVKQDGSKEAAINELRGQVEEAKKSLEAKTGAVTVLEGKIAQLEESLSLANAELGSKNSTASSLEEAKIASESLLAAAQETLTQAQKELADAKSTLESVTKELADARVNTLAQDKVIQDLQAAVASHKEKMTELEANHAKAVADLTEAGAAERGDHLKAQAELRSRVADIEAQSVAHAAVVQELEARNAKLKEVNEGTEPLQARLTTLLAEKEETANKVSELEIEILELKESQESLEDVQNALQSRVDELLRKLADADEATAIAAEAASKRDAEHSEILKELSKKHEQELEASAARVTEITASLDKLRTEYDELIGDLEKTKKDITSKEEEHNLKLAEMEKAHAHSLSTLSSQLEEVSRNLNDQESIYNKKVDSLNAEHAKLLEDAFERAKSEAGHAHGLELQELRSNSNSAIQELQEANRNSVEELKAEHASALENELGSLNKHISKLNLELKATQDDLAKAKTALEASRGEIESLAQQRDNARAQADAAPVINPEQAALISLMEKELESTKDDLAQTTNTLILTKSSMAELSDKHAKELEAAAKGRAEEVVQLRAVHDAEVSDLATKKTELMVKLSDLEGELATAKAALAAHQASPKANGTSHPPSPGVPREELQKLHEAHNLKIHDMQADHDKGLKSVKDELEEALNKIQDLQLDLGRKDMEIQFLGQEQEESQEHISRLKSDLEAMSERPQPA